MDSRFTVTGAIHVVCSFVLIICGGLGVLKYQEIDSPYSVGSVIWNVFSWLFLLAVGFLTIATGLKPQNQGLRKAVQAMSIIESVLAGIATIVVGLAFLGLALLHAVATGANQSNPDQTSQAVLDAIASITTLLSVQLVALAAHFILAIVIASFICCGDKSE